MLYVGQSQEPIIQHPHHCSLGNEATTGYPPSTSTGENYTARRLPSTSTLLGYVAYQHLPHWEAYDLFRAAEVPEK
jgi:hypothetical protein